MSRRPKIEVLRERAEVLRLQSAISTMEKRAAFKAQYDATESNKQRRQASRESGGEDSIYDMARRLKGCNIGRDLERNYSPAKSLLHQLRVNVVGSLGKIQVNVPGDTGKLATEWFNEVWSKDCDFRDDCDWSTMLQNIVASVPREGDCLAVFDDNLIEDSGKLLTFEADQIAPLSEDALKASRWPKATQDNGIMRDEWGRVLGYATSGKRGLQVLQIADKPTLWQRGDARLISNPWRLNQGRGVPSMITPASNFIDLYEILSSELATTKRAAKQYAYVKRADAVTDYDSPASGAAFLSENGGKDAAEVALEGANESAATGARNYDKIEALTGGYTDYIDPKDDVLIPDLKHPNSQIAAFLETVQGYGGAALGLARAYTILRADSSYTAFRGDMIMTWVTFYWLQKWLERKAADWVARKALAWAVRKKQIKPLADGWERTLSWTWPRMPEVDQLDAENATAAALKNGTTDYGQLLGPDWRRRLEGLAEQIKTARQLLLPLGVLETASGGQIAENPKKQGDDAAQKTADQIKESGK